MMEANGFEFSLGETGIGSGGTFAVGQFQRDDRILAFSVRYGLRGSTLHPGFRPFSESASSAGAGLKAATAEVPWWHVCNSYRQT